jgi:signal transduction histidine kinase
MSSTTAPAPPGRIGSLGREAALVALSVVVGLVVFGATLVYLDESGASGTRAEALLLLDFAGGILAIALMPLRKHAPVVIAATLGVIAAMSAFGILASMIALVSVATRRRPREIALVAAAWVVALVAWELAGLAHTPLDEGDGPLFAITIVLVVGLPVVVGLYVGGRRELLASLRERARLAEEDEALRLEQAADHERTRIAREMHDVLAHRLSLVALHAGALEYRDDLDASEVRRTATIVRENARTALTELREVLGSSGIRRARRPSLPRSRRSPTSRISSTRRGPSGPRCGSTSTPPRATGSRSWARRRPVTRTGSSRSA